MCNHKEMYCITNCVCEPVLSKLHAKFMTQFPLPLLTFLEYSSQWGYLCYTWDCSLHTKGFTKQGGDGPQVQCQHWLCRCWSHWCENTAGLCALHAAARVWITPSLSARCPHWPWHVQLDPHLDFCLSMLATSCSLMPAPVWQFLERSLHRTTGMGCLYHASEKT